MRRHKTKVYRVPVTHSAVRRAHNEVFNVFCALIAVCVLTASAIVARADDTPKKAPESVTISADAVRSLQDAAKDARIAQLEAENLNREIQLAQARLKDLVETAKRAQDASNAAFIRACVKAGIPADDVPQYEGTPQADGSLVLKRKAPPTPPAK